MLGVGQPGGAEAVSETHPPLSLRLRVLFRYLDRLGHRRLPAYAVVWQDYLKAASSDLPPFAAFLAEKLVHDDHPDRLIDFVDAWGSQQGSASSDAAAWVERELLDEIPGDTHCRPSNGGQRQSVAVADVVNAAWAARTALDIAASGDTMPTGALAASRIDPHQKRLRIDSLASKAIDSIELARLWGPDRGVISVDDQTLTQAAAYIPAGADTPVGALSRSAIADRLRANREDRAKQRLVVSPLFADSLQDAGVDLRLGPDFIVFLHSAIGGFDPLDTHQDPRMLQERVHKAWGERFMLHPGELVLASTLEYIVTPQDVVAQVVTRSSYGRLGLITATAVQVQPGSRGCITLELVNHGDTPIALSPGARIAQLLLIGLPYSNPVAPGKYWFPVGPEFSRVEQDPDAPRLRMIASPRQRSPALGRPGSS